MIHLEVLSEKKTMQMLQKKSSENYESQYFKNPLTDQHRTWMVILKSKGKSLVNSKEELKGDKGW